MMDPDLAHLADHVELILALVESRARQVDEPAVAEAMQRFVSARERIVERECSGGSLAAGEMFHRLGLGETEQYVVWLLAALATSHGAAALVARATGERGHDPTLGAIRLLIHGTQPSRQALDELSDASRLRRFEVIERSDGGGAELHESSSMWALSRRVLDVLHGNRTPDPRFHDRRQVPPSVDELAIRTSDREPLIRVVRSRGTVLIVGSPGAGRRTAATVAARDEGLEVLEIDAACLAKDALARQLRTLARECKLLGRVPLIANIDALDAAQIELVGSELVAQLEGPVLVTSGISRPVIRWGRPAIVIELGKPTSEQLGQLWLRELGQGSASDAEILATRYPLAPALIHHAAAAAKARAVEATVTPEDIYAGIRTVLDDRLGQYAKRVTVTQTWEDLVLPQEQVDSIVELMARVRGRRRVYEQWGFGPKVGKGLGVSALFSGPPGTGKTMVAALIARDLGLELYQVDLGKVVSKWIGETEKNLGAVFDAAEAGHAILLFDEADALFGKRTEVKSSNDRNANLETNYLLQRLESFTGICLLTSNHESNIDPAFQRRLSLHLRFDVPDLAERALLWRAMLPQAAPVTPDVDFESLARRYSMSGGYIRNAAVRAAFMAADEEVSISALHLEQAARLEYEGMGKLVGG